MTTANLPTAPADPGTALEDVCDACEHPLSGHDALGVRFCAATVSAALSRGCICR